MKSRVFCAAAYIRVHRQTHRRGSCVASTSSNVEGSDKWTTKNQWLGSPQATDTTGLFHAHSKIHRNAPRAAICTSYTRQRYRGATQTIGLRIRVSRRSRWIPANSHTGIISRRRAKHAKKIDGFTVAAGLLRLALVSQML